MTTTPPPSDELTEFAELVSHEEEFGARRTLVDPVLRRARLRRRLIAVAVVVLVLLGTAGTYVGWALTAPVSAPAVTWRSVPVPSPPPATLTTPGEGAWAISVTGAEEYLGAEASGIWASSGTDEQRSLASISKIITALVILEAQPLESPADPGPTITFSKADHDLYDKYYLLGATIAAMPTGSSMSLHDALATMLIPSASNYAEALSTWAYGSPWAFVRATERWLAEHGMNGTTIVEPTGIDARNVSTPGDMLTLGKLAAANPVIAQIVATPSLSVPGLGSMPNTNGLLGTEGITGLKTGNLGEGSYSLLYTAHLDVGAGPPLGITGVTLGGRSRESVNAGVLATLNSIRAGFHWVPVAERGDPVGSYSTPWGSTARIVVRSKAAIFTWSDTPITASRKATAPKAYVDGEKVGTITWTAGSRTAEAILVMDGAIAPPTAWWRLTHPQELGMW